MARPYGDPYQILGLGPDTAEKEIRKAYRRLVLRHHPDRNPGDPAAADKFRQVQWAYEFIMKPRTGKSLPVRTGNVSGASDFASQNDPHPFLGFYQALREFWRKEEI